MYRPSVYRDRICTSTEYVHQPNMYSDSIRTSTKYVRVSASRMDRPCMYIDSVCTSTEYARLSASHMDRPSVYRERICTSTEYVQRPSIYIDRVCTSTRYVHRLWVPNHGQYLTSDVTRGRFPLHPQISMLLRRFLFDRKENLDSNIDIRGSWAKLRLKLRIGHGGWLKFHKLLIVCTHTLCSKKHLNGKTRQRSHIRLRCLCLETRLRHSSLEAAASMSTALIIEFVATRISMTTSSTPSYLEPTALFNLFWALIVSFQVQIVTL